jgi:hypothetical protein
VVFQQEPHIDSNGIKELIATEQETAGLKPDVSVA